MKTLEQISQQYKSQTLDGRDISRLSQFIPYSKLSDFGLTLKEGVTEEDWNKDVKDFTRENVLKQLEKDLEFAFEKALNQRGISASLMYDVVKMWNRILEEGLENEDEYMWYGLPLFKKTAVKYGFDNPIGSDNGDESEYGDEIDYGWEI